MQDKANYYYGGGDNFRCVQKAKDMMIVEVSHDNYRGKA